MANIIGINFESIVDGDGVRVVVFFSGCNHKCKGCHNPTSHDFVAGRAFDDEIQSRIIEYIKETPFIAGVTLSGGDPMYSADDVIPFIQKLKSTVPNATVWVYSGFTYEELCTDDAMRNLLDLCDVLVDGPFILEQRDITLNYRGSKNQRIVDIQHSRSSGKIVFWQDLRNAV